ncbi:DUF6766 family protein [Luteolibacter soli]|uniref:DUF6766 family protein n=1 Tax=Luteolibacter soli TaxID=3135280 RepID=A0ABU9ANU8_9BACT
MKRLFHENGLSIVLLLAFLIFWAAQSVTGFHVYQKEQHQHGQPAEDYTGYLTGAHFWQATGENWESEFLQMGAYVVLTTYFFQRGSAESHNPDDAEKLKRERKAKETSWLYSHSLSLALFVLFALSFVIHATGGWREFNDERFLHGEPPATLGEFLTDAEFWFQSFQNWQSEFLAVLAIVVLSIFLRQNGSPESKDVDASHWENGD